jgi:hypothetical protein
MKKGIGIAIAIVAGLLWQFVIGPQMEVSTKNALDSGWDDAKAEVAQQQKAAYAESLKGIGLSDAVLDALAGCTADKAIAFLNTTDCSYLYNQTTTSEEEHLAEQEKCMDKVGYSAKEEQFSFECMKANIPNDWNIMSAQLKESLAAGFVAEGLDAAIAGPYAECAVPKMVALMKKRECPLINKTAEKPEDLMLSSDDCFKDMDTDKEFAEIFTGCAPTPPAEGEPTPEKK